MCRGEGFLGNMLQNSSTLVISFFWSMKELFSFWFACFKFFVVNLVTLYLIIQDAVHLDVCIT